MSYSLIPTADYKAACDAIRAKTGKTDLIKSGDMAMEITSIPTGGGGGTPYEGNPYLTFSSANAFTIATSNSTKNWEGTLYYSTDTETWNEWNGTTAVASAEHEGEQRIYMRGVQNVNIGGSSNTNRWVLTGDSIACHGNIDTLLDYELLLAGYIPPKAKYCYSYMFNGCTSLVTAPELPATTLASYCYSSMFKGCTSIKLSTTQTDEYVTAYRIPTSGIGTTATSALSDMFTSTGGTFTGTPTINTIYYTSNTVV